MLVTFKKPLTGGLKPGSRCLFDGGVHRGCNQAVLRWRGSTEPIPKCLGFQGQLGVQDGKSSEGGVIQSDLVSQNVIKRESRPDWSGS